MQVPLLRIPHHLLPRIFFSLEPSALVNLTACSSTMKKSIIAHRAIPFVVETVCSPSIHQISFVFVDDVPCKVSFTVSTQDVDWMHCPYTRHEHRVDQKRRRIASDFSHLRMLRWLYYLSDVFAVGLQMGTMDLCVKNGDTLMSRIMYDEPMTTMQQTIPLYRLVAISNCSHVNIDEFDYLWRRTRLPRLASLHLYPTSGESERRELDDDDVSEIESVFARFGVCGSKVIGGKDINPYLIYGISRNIGQYIRPLDPVQEMCFPEIILVVMTLSLFSFFAFTALLALYTVYSTPLSVPLFITFLALGAATACSVMGLACAVRNWKFYIVDEWVSHLFYTVLTLWLVGLVVCDRFVRVLL